MSHLPQTGDGVPLKIDRGRLFLLNEASRNYLMAAARKRLRSQSIGPASASDLVQDVMIAAVDAEAHGDGPADSSDDRRRWLGGILRNTINNKFRRVRVGVILKSEPADPGTSPSSQVSRNEEKGRFDAAFASLSEDDRQLLTWVFDEGLARREIADRLGVSPSYASQVCIRALRRWREACESLGR